MKLRVIIVGLVAVAASSAAAQTAPLGSPMMPKVEETGKVPLDCDKRLGAHQFAKQRYEAKVKIGTQTWEDVANYHSTRADWLECVANGQFEAIKAERRARNEVITSLNALSARENQLDEEIVAAQELFAQCDRAPLPTEAASAACAAQTFASTCSQNTLRRLFAKENGRSDGPRAHMLRSVLGQSLVRRAALLQCVVDQSQPVETVSPAEAATPAAPVAQKAANQ